VTAAPSMRRWSTYLLLPRPADLLGKGLFTVVPLALSAAVAPGGHATVASAALTFVVLELLTYQARYAVNDLLGVAEDIRHPYAARRHRLPDRSTATVAAVVAMVLVRVALALALAARLPAPLRRGVLTAVLAVAVLAAGYELLRRRISSLPGRDVYVTRPACLLLWTWVGLGYGVRAALGTWVGAAGAAPLAVTATVLVTVSALGTMHVTMAWALEGVAALAADPAAAAPGGILERKSHLGPLVRFAGRGATGGRGPLHAPTALSAPWNVGLLLAAPLAGVEGAQTAFGLRWDLPTGAVAGAAASALAAAAVLARATRPAVLAAAAIGSAAVCAGACAAAGAATPAAAAVPPASVFLVYLVLRRLSYRDLLRSPAGRSVERAAAG
jgi:hypothetical protein